MESLSKVDLLEWAKDNLNIHLDVYLETPELISSLIKLSL